ncbi:MAG: aldehyde dehydrogenase family protein, partial [Planococcus citreus]
MSKEEMNSEKVQRIPLLIDGQWIGEEREDVYSVYAPANGHKLAEIVRGNGQDVERAVQTAQIEFESDAWQNIKPFERGQLLVRLAQHIRDHRDEWAARECQDVGKPLSQAYADVEAAARYFEFYGGAADKVAGETIPIENGLLNVTVLEPVGITVHIVPWNYPLQIIARSVGAALATGNAVIVKSAEDTPLSAHALAEWFAASELPKGIFQHLTGLGQEVGAPLVAHPGINHVTFTGSVQTGISVMKAAAENVV